MEISILIVDDDKILVEKLEETVQWEKIGISMVFTAYNIRQAQKLLEEFPIQLLLCDIDMPQGSGLELLEWVRSEQMDVECVFLSSYANFAYAQKALRLSTREYLLKPISNQDLEAVLGKIVKAMQEKAIRRNGESRRRSREEFWQEFFMSASEQEQMLHRAIQEQKYRREDILFLETIRIFADHKDINYKKDLSLFNFVIRNITVEYFTEKELKLDAVVPVSDYEWALVFRKSGEEKLFLEASKELKKHLNKILPQRSCMYIGEGRPVSETAVGWKRIELMEKTILPGQDGIVRESDLPEEKGSSSNRDCYETPPWEVWQKSLNTPKNIKDTSQDVCQFLSQMFEQHVLTIENLERFLRELEQMLYCYLGERQINFSQMFDSRVFDRKEKEAFNSLNATLAFVEWVFETLTGSSQYGQDQEDVVGRVKEYIENHLGEELSRSLLAKKVYLSEDYVSKLFKATTGMSIPSYIAARRIEKAKDYLAHSGLPVSQIALEVGYSNFSYFSKSFRDLTGMTPNEYRNQVSKESK